MEVKQSLEKLTSLFTSCVMLGNSQAFLMHPFSLCKMKKLPRIYVTRKFNIMYKVDGTMLGTWNGPCIFQKDRAELSSLLFIDPGHRNHELNYWIHILRAF